MARLATSRILKNNSPESLELRIAFEADRKTVDEYLDVLSFLRTATEKPSVDIYVVKDSNHIIQGLCSTTNKTDYLYLHAIASAPWNIRMSTPSPVSSYKGIGKQLIETACENAIKNGLIELRTQPLASSIGFYKTIGMQEKEDYWFLPIDPYLTEEQAIEH